MYIPWRYYRPFTYSPPQPLNFLAPLMILGTLVTNLRTNKLLARMKEPVPNEKIEFFLLEFMNSAVTKAGTIYKDLYKYIYIYYEDNYYVLITSLFFSEVKAANILNHLINSPSTDPLDMLVSIDNIIYGDNIVFPNLSIIKNMDSQEEKIYKMMMENKELEVRRKQKQLKLKTGNKLLETTKKLEEIHNKQLELTRRNLETLNLQVEKKESKKTFETSSSPVFVCFKERIKCTMDIENNLKASEVLGEMTINVKEEKYKNLEIQLEGEYKDCKFSPKLMKDSSKTGILKSEKPFSLNKNIALLKWKDSKIPTMPLELSYWPSEIKPNTYQISFEFTTAMDLENLSFSVPKKNLTDVTAEGVTITLDCIEWKVGSVASGESDSLEFQCKTSDLSLIFPIDVYFTSLNCYRDLNITKTVIGEEEIESIEIKKVLEVDSFAIEGE